MDRGSTKKMKGKENTCSTQRGVLFVIDWDSEVIVYKGFWSYTAFIYHAELREKGNR